MILNHRAVDMDWQAPSRFPVLRPLSRLRVGHLERLRTGGTIMVLWCFHCARKESHYDHAGAWVCSCCWRLNFRRSR